MNDFKPGVWVPLRHSVPDKEAHERLAARNDGWRELFVRAPEEWWRQPPDKMLLPADAESKIAALWHKLPRQVRLVISQISVHTVHGTDEPWVHLILTNRKVADFALSVATADTTVAQLCLIA